MPRDPYEVLGVARDADETRHQEGLPRARARAAPRRQHARPRGRGEVQGGRRGLRDPLRRRAPRDLRPLRPRGLRSGGYAPNFDGFGSIGDLFDAFFGGGGSAAFGGAAGAARVQGGDVAVAVEIDAREAARGDDGRGRATRPSTAASTATATAPSPARRSRPASAAAAPAQLQAVTRTPFGQIVRTSPATSCGGDGRVAEQPCRECGGRGRVVRPSARSSRRAGRHRRRPAHPRSPAAATPASAAGRRATSTCSCACAEDERFVRDGDDLVTVLDVAGAAARRSARRVTVPTLDGEREVELAAGTQPGEVLTLRGEGMPPLRRRPPRRPARRRQRRRSRARLTREQRELLERARRTR